MKKFYFCGYFGERVAEQHLADIKDDDDVVLLSENLDKALLNNPVMRKLFNLCHRWKRIDKDEPIFADFWNRYYALSRMDFDKNNEHYIVFWNSALSRYYSESFFKHLKKHSNVKLIFYIYDHMTQFYSPRILRMAKYADAIYCTIPEDCEKYGFTYFPLVYPTRKPVACDETDCSDIYFMGNDGGRFKKLKEVAEYLRENGVKSELYMVGVDESQQDKELGIVYNKNLSTEENLCRESATNCILEIMHEGMNAVTSRYPEALTLNKKLLTNNKNVTTEKYYNPQYIKIFDDVSDIDPEWVKKKEPVDYGYKGEFSARGLIDQITQRFSLVNS